MRQADIGLWGLGVMGQNLAQNMAANGFTVAVYERDPALTRQFVATAASSESIIPAFEPPQFCAALKRPRQVFLMIKAGKPVDAVLGQITAALSAGDVVIDGGNSHFEDTIRRHRRLKQKGIALLGVGISGGAEGARKGPAIMAGGSKAAYAAVEPILSKISAHVDGEPCCTYCGEDGAGHFVKMVHNGIEYGVMQVICEAYALLKSLLHMTTSEMQRVFARWNGAELNSYLMEITTDILSKNDPETGRPLVEMILDKAGQKGTGAWASQCALQLGVPVPTISAAVQARSISALRDERVAAATELTGPREQFDGDADAFIRAIHDAVHAALVCCYAQGFALLAAGARAYNWQPDLQRVARIWRGGCIIRARLLTPIVDAFARNPHLPNLLVGPHFKTILNEAQGQWRTVVATAVRAGIPVSGLSSALAYFDSYRNPRLAVNLIQAQRDYFGAHAYERTDRAGVFHTDWTSI
ncbi:MAG: NADP-dependent phosphogluconate dehydrogenase [Phycisphaerae bacterium]